MTIIVRLLDGDADRDLLIEAWHFRDTAPRWFRECLDIFKETKDEYLENAKGELHFGVFEDDRLDAVIRLIPEKPTVWNIHLSARKGIALETLLAAGVNVRERMLKHDASFYGYLPERNKGISRLYEALGFVDSGLRLYKGVVHGKVVAWKHFILLNEQSFKNVALQRASDAAEYS
jgi:hypothetical protein